MAHEIVIPRLGWTMDEGTFVGWLKRDGEFVKRGEPLFDLEGEKAAQEIEALDEGILRIPANSPRPGSVVLVGTVVGYLTAAGEDLPSQASVKIPLASPRARRVARELKIDCTTLTGSGVEGRIRERDVRAAAATRQQAPLTKRRQVIARRMADSRQQTVPVTLTTRADATNLVGMRRNFEQAGARSPFPTYQDLIMKLAAGVLARHPMLAGRLEDGTIVVPTADEFHIGIAVDTAEGLLVPVVRNVAALSFSELAAQTRRLIDRARAGQLTAAEMQGGVFTITNLGAFGIDAFTPVINPPESAILGLGALRREPVVLEDGQLAARQMWSLSLTFDHRVIDGAPAARFLQDLVAAVGSPAAT